MGKKIKYLGTSHEHSLEKGEDWNGRLADPLTKRVLWSIDNRFLVDSEEAGLSDEAVELLVEDTDTFKDVTDLKRIPVSAAEDLWYGVKDKSYEAENASVDADGNLHRNVDAAATGASATSDAPANVGGSTSTDSGAGGAKGGGRTGRGTVTQ